MPRVSRLSESLGSIVRSRSSEQLLTLSAGGAEFSAGTGAGAAPPVAAPVQLSTTPPSILFPHDAFYRCDIGGGVSVVRAAAPRHGSFEGGGGGESVLSARAAAEPPAWLLAYLVKRGRALCAEACAECERRGPLVVVALRRKRRGGPRALYVEAHALAPCLRVPLVRALLAHYEPRHECVVALVESDGERLVCEPFICSVVVVGVGVVGAVL